MLLVVLDNWYKTETETDPSGQLGSIFEGTSGSYFDGQRVADGFRAHTFCHCVFCSDSDVNYSDYKNNC